ncbi:Type VI secretion system (T6SS), amidase immunity protein [Cupriavidus sp. OV038]|uniref:T6SS amidase immunity protein Tai4 family protein n=1 Tax=unclassified Cupriavidus TaxID=2640874 RepID=UPI0008EE6E4D|nr:MULTISPECIES: T6SS amidase immunity protein Tai4 family protein [unclassified Cupriavidus]SFC82778.1 Type VI secretion system (T6SS), amidase immunity protein [Cupriavidus sp. OV038]SFO79142.1 Type VI secretion system (T6SS), amidase immunity protein [Cupriavidus sp. OV096]
MLRIRWLMLASCAAWALTANAKAPDTHASDAQGRTYGQNYKDMVLARCIARAYEGDAAASADAGQTADELSASLYYDMASSIDAIPPLVDQFLARDYRNPRLKAHSMGQQFRLLKCLDLYHSRALQDQVKRHVPRPNQTHRQEP